MTKLVLETKNQADETPYVGGVMLTPSIGDDYWAHRDVLSEKQAIIDFPKFTTIGIGFAEEEDWNENLPYTSDAEQIFRHIRPNKGDDSISDEDCIEAIRMIQETVRSEMSAVRSEMSP